MPPIKDLKFSGAFNVAMQLVRYGVIGKTLTDLRMMASDHEEFYVMLESAGYHWNDVTWTIKTDTLNNTYPNGDDYYDEFDHDDDDNDESKEGWEEFERNESDYDEDWVPEAESNYQIARSIR